MKRIIALFLLASGSAFASESATCTLVEKSFATTDYIHYEIVNESIISKKTVSDPAGIVTIEDSIYPVSYSVKFDMGHAIRGHLSIKIDQPGPADSDIVATDEVLQLKVEDLYNGGMTVYELACQLDRA